MRDPVPDLPEFRPDFRLKGGALATSRRVLLALGIAFLVFSLSIGVLTPNKESQLHFKYAYLVSFMFYLTITLGGLFLVMVHHLTGAKWSVVLRRLFETAAMNIFPLMIILFIPILIWLPDLYS